MAGCPFPVTITIAAAQHRLDPLDQAEPYPRRHLAEERRALVVTQYR